MIYTRCDVDALGVKLDCRVLEDMSNALMGLCVDELSATLDKMRTPRLASEELTHELVGMAERINRLSAIIVKNSEVLYALRMCKQRDDVQVVNVPIAKQTEY
jgi:hypothetical protein